MADGKVRYQYPLSDPKNLHGRVIAVNEQETVTYRNSHDEPETEPYLAKNRLFVLVYDPFDGYLHLWFD